MSSADDNAPEIMKLTAELNHDSIRHVEPKAGMFLLFLVSGSTMLGTLSGTVLSAYYMERRGGTHWLIGILAGSALGGVLGCGLGMLLLGFKGLIHWERQEHLAEREQHKI